MTKTITKKPSAAEHGHLDPERVVERQPLQVEALQAENKELRLQLEMAEETIRSVQQAATAESLARRSVEERLEAELADSMLLQRVSAEIMQSEVSQAIYDKIMDAAVSIMRSDFASMQLLYPERGERGELRLLACRGYDLAAAKFWEWVRTDSGCTCGMAMSTGQRAIAADVQTCEFMVGSPDQANALRMGMLAMQSTPLIARSGKLVGMISTHWKQPHTPSERDLRLLDILARQAADLLERKQAEESLRASEEKYRALFESMDEGYCVIEFFDGPHGPLSDYVHVEANPAYSANAGIPDIVGRKVREMVPDEADGWVEIYRNVLITGEPVRFERELVATGRYLELSAFRLEPAERLQVAVLFKDITARRRAEEALREADRRKNEFLAMLAHELRNPLAPIRNAVQILRLTGGQGESVSSASEMMERQVGQMVRLVDDLLDVSRLSRGKIELRKGRVELASVIVQAVEAVRPHCEMNGLELTVTLPSNPIVLNADQARLAQIVGNLLNNACKFTKNGGHIWLTVEQHDKHAVIQVRDNGIGIDRDQFPRIFDMFMQIDTSLERSTSGLGIGLALVKNLVEMHDGAVEVQSDGIGQGSAFTVRLPIIVESPKAPPQPTKDKPKTKTGLRILVVDDNRDSATTLALLLKLKGNETHTAYDGLEAVDKAARINPDVILLDIGLPKLNGYEACGRIREQPWGKKMRLIALTGWGQEEDREKTRVAGFDAHMVKPVEFDALMKHLAEMDVPTT